MSDLSAWLLERVAEDEVTARDAATIPQHARIPADVVIFYNGEERPARPGCWGWNGGPFRVADTDPRIVAAFELTDSDDPYRVVVEDAWDDDEPNGNAYYVATIPSDHDAARHIARWDPARVLDWCAAVRAVVELHPDARDDHSRALGVEPYCGTCAVGWRDDSQRWPCPTLLALAQPYADQPGWREEWAL